MTKTDAATICANCGGERWVCENHPDRPWNDGGCECGAGMPCSACNPCDENTPPLLPPDSVTLWSVHDDKSDGFEKMPVKGEA